jgi:endonuclease-8
MPEGDTIFRAARALNGALAGGTVRKFDTAYAQLARVNDDTPVVGRTVERVEARGKWLLMYFSGDLILATHMLMSGSWHMYRVVNGKAERWRYPRSAMRVMIATDAWEAIAFNVQIAEFHTEKSLALHRSIAKLGPDLLGRSFDQSEAAMRLRERVQDEVGVALLNQRVMAGIGNVFMSEICFACKVNPFRAVATLTATEVKCLIDTSLKFLAANVKDESSDGIVTYSGLRRTTGHANREERLWVYGRQGRHCRRCGNTILSRKQGMDARSTYWCAVCQPMGEGQAEVDGWSHEREKKKTERS